VTPRGEVTIGQARKFVQEGAVQVNGVQQTDSAAQLSANTAIYGKYHLLRRGKKQFHLLVWQ
jgi:tyrosyl-tRNA synthetase